MIEACSSAIGYDSAMSNSSELNGNARRSVLERLPLGMFDATPPLVDAVSSLYEHLVDRTLATSDRVTSAAEGKKLLATDDGTEAVADHIQRVVVLAIPVLRTFARGARFTRIPWVLVATTAFSIGSAVRSGVREAQVIGSLVAHRLEQATAQPADPALVKRLTLELYLAPKRTPDPDDLTLPVGLLLRRWLIKGAIGRDTKKAASKALDAAERLDLRPYLSR
jgi:hypothetical protein